MAVWVRYRVPGGPLCFIMYVDDLISYILQDASARIVMYADDTVLITDDNNPEDAVSGMQELLNLSNMLCRRNKLSINATKTKHMFKY